MTQILKNGLNRLAFKMVCRAQVQNECITNVHLPLCDKNWNDENAATVEDVVKDNSRILDIDLATLEGQMAPQIDAFSPEEYH